MRSVNFLIKRHHTIWVAIGVVSFAAVTFMYMRIHRAPARMRPPEKVTIAISNTVDASLAHIALAQGYFLQEGLEVTPHPFWYGKVALDDVLEGKADFATVSETPIMFAVMKGESLSIIATMQTFTRNSAVIARKDKGILTPGDLKGRKIGATLGTTSDFYLHVFLTLHGIEKKEVTVVDLKPEEMPDAIANGKVDAISIFLPYLIYAQRKLGERGITFYDDEIYTFTFNVVAMREFVRDNPGTVHKMLRALIRAEEFVNRNPAQAQKIVADVTQTDIALVREIWDYNTFGVKLDQALVLALEDESRWAIEGGFVKNQKIPNYLDYIYIDGLMAVKPEAVRFLE